MNCGKWTTCIFDLDGTLLETLKSMYVSVNKTMDRLGLPAITIDECRRFVGCGADYLIRESLKAVGDVEMTCFNDAKRMYAEIFRDYCTYDTIPYKGITELLGNLKSKGFKLGVLSNKPHERANQVILNAFGDEIFDAVMGQCDDRPRKPDPAGVYELLGMLKGTPESCVYIGDSEIDVRTGRRAGIFTIAVSWGFRDRMLLTAEHPDFIADNAEGLGRYILADHCILESREE